MKTLLIRQFFVGWFLFVASYCFGQFRAQNPEYRKYNPAYHFYPSGDPTGLFYYSGLYYNNWGIASSKDFVHWQYTPGALSRNRINAMVRDSTLSKSYRDSLARVDSISRRQGRLGGSGTIVIDWNNTSGFGKNGEPPLVSLWHNGVQPWSTQVVGVAYSNDTAKTWTRYEKFPVLDINSREFRDPKVFWYEPTKKWIMVIGWAEVPKIKFFSSANLKDWELMSDFGPWGAVDGVWECADFFPLSVDGNPSKIKWVLAISVQPQNAQYFIGDFDGKRFSLDPQFTQTLAGDINIPKGDLLFDFEKGIDDWQMEGDAFVESPSNQALFQQGAIMGQQGNFFINSFHNRGAGTGKITSPVFKITRSYINFLSGGNYIPNDESINLLVDNKIVRSQTGNNSGGLRWTVWNVAEFRGKTARVEIIDKNNNGAIYADHFIITDKAVYTGRQKAFWIDYGADFFAVRSWNNYVENEKRKIWTAWMGSWRYGGTEPVRGIQTVPRELNLKTFPEGVRLIQNPIAELQSLRTTKRELPERIFEGVWIPDNIAPTKNTYEVEVEFQKQTADSFGIQLCTGNGQKTIVGYSVKEQEIYVDRRNSGLDNFIGLFKEISKGPLKNRNNNLKLHIFVDNCSIEVFANDGETVLSSKIYPDPSNTGIQFFSDNGKVEIKSFKIWDLSPVDMGQ
ncbi:MAG TPA: GH32 C-terminal domain-containing protein [Chitinophagaceae bacterium]|nr:GH32 C-terminal domain-containing protein [Chitinophagaceae bacterium]